MRLQSSTVLVFKERYSYMGLRHLFLLDPAVIHLNHESFGACPRPVFQDYQEWQHHLEHNPVDFLDRRAPGLMADARAALAEYVGCGSDDLVVSWGWEAEHSGASRFVDYHEWQGTRDLATFLSVPAAIEFQHKYRWDDVRRCFIELAVETRGRLI